MGDLEEKLNSILSNSEAMGQIMQLAHSLGGSQPGTSPPSPPPYDMDSSHTSPGPDLFSSLNDLDPRFLELAIHLLNAYRSNDDERAALLSALRPFLRPERYARLDQAIQISKLTKVIRIALDSFRKEEEGGQSGHV